MADGSSRMQARHKAMLEKLRQRKSDEAPISTPGLRLVVEKHPEADRPKNKTVLSPPLLPPAPPPAVVAAATRRKSFVTLHATEAQDSLPAVTDLSSFLPETLPKPTPDAENGAEPELLAKGVLAATLGAETAEASEQITAAVSGASSTVASKVSKETPLTSSVAVSLNILDGWAPKLDVTTGATYYYHKVTKEVSWTVPSMPVKSTEAGDSCGTAAPPSAQTLISNDQIRNSGKGTVTEDPIWFEGFDEAHQVFYYFNSLTKESIWEKPDSPFVPYGNDGDSEEEDGEESEDEGLSSKQAQAHSNNFAAAAPDVDRSTSGDDEELLPSQFAWIPAHVDERQCRTLVGELLFNEDEFHHLAVARPAVTPPQQVAGGPIPGTLVPMLDRRGLATMCREQLFFELDEGKFTMLAQARKDKQPGLDQHEGPGGRSIVIHNAEELAELFVELILDDSKFMKP
jgi:hypothetical protein